MAQSDPATGSFSSTRAMAGPIVTETRSTISVAHFPRIASWALLDASRPICSSPPPATILDSIEKQVLDRLKIPQNLMLLTFSLPQLSRSRMDEIRDMLDRWAEWDILTSIASYHSVVKILFGVLSEVSRRRSGNSHTVAEDILQKMSQDVSVIHEQLIGILRVPESYKSFLVCRGPLAQQLLDLLQDLLDSFPESLARPLLSKALLRLSRASGLHPTCFTLSGLQKVGQQVAAGAFGDIWKGLIRGQSVSVKIMRLFRDVKAALLEFGREALIWRQLSHPNLLPFFGLYYLDSRLCLVSPWMSNGHVLEFLENAPPGTDRLSLILDIAMGLEYLHGKHVVHGDLKGMNILVTPSRRACLADFGLSSIADAMTLRFTHSTSASARGGTARYQAPELISTDNPNHFESDVYAFACVCYEILTGKAPFFEFPRDVTVSIKVLEGLRPSRPETVPYDALWVLLQNCWEEQPVKRPDISQIIQRLVRPPIGAKTRQSATDWDEAFSAKVRRSLQDWPLLPSVSAVERRVFGDGASSFFLYLLSRMLNASSGADAVEGE
ncbi:kinase-like domain-containing protein [Mycena vulgaris]|nr:kinase-like domain-containing protein [Mycena vulgaris]